MSSSQRIITDTNKGPLVQVLTLYFLVLIILSCLVRAGTKLIMIKTLKIDDLLAILAAVLATAQSTIVFIACDNGLGKPFDELNTRNIASFYKSQYVANVLFIASIFCSKLSGTMGLRMMSRQSQKWIIIACEATVAVWGISGIIASLLQCRLPTPWDYSDAGRCINRTVFWSYHSVVNILSDIFIVTIIADNVRRIQTSVGKKVLVISVFGSRILVIPAVGYQIYYSNRAFTSRDASFSAWEATVAIQLVQCLAIFTVCVPNLKPFLDSLESGQIRVDDLRRQGRSGSGYPTSRPNHSGYRSPLHSQSKNSSALRSKSRDPNSIDVLASGTSHRSEVHEMVDLPKSKSRLRGQQQAQGEGQRDILMTVHEPNHGYRSWDGQSHTSHSSQSILIHQTWQVDVQDTHGGASDQGR